MAFLGRIFFNLDQISQDLTNSYLNYSAKFYQLENSLAGLLDILQSKTIFIGWFFSKIRPKLDLPAVFWEVTRI